MDLHTRILAMPKRLARLEEKLPAEKAVIFGSYEATDRIYGHVVQFMDQRMLEALVKAQEERMKQKFLRTEQ